MAVAVRQPATAAPLPASAPARQRRVRAQERQRGVVGSVLWITLLATLLAGIVALNVAVLDLNLRLDQLARERTRLQAENAQIAARLSRAGATQRVGALARTRLGLVPAPPEKTSYPDLRK